MRSTLCDPQEGLKKAKEVKNYEKVNYNLFSSSDDFGY